MRKLLAAALCAALSVDSTAALITPRRAGTVTPAPVALAPAALAPAALAPAALAPAAVAAIARVAGLAVQSQAVLESVSQAPPPALGQQAGRWFDGGLQRPPVVAGLERLRKNGPADPTPRPPRKRMSLRKKLIIATLSVALAGGVAYKLLSPRLDPVEPPPTVVDEDGRVEWREDAQARLLRGSGGPQAPELLLQNEGAVVFAALDESMKTAVTLAANGSWTIWDLETGKAMSPRRYAGRARAAAWRDGGSELVLLDHDGTVRIVDRASGRVQTLRQSAGPVDLHAISPDGRHLAYATAKGLVFILDLATAQNRAFQSQGRVGALTARADGTIIANYGAGKVIIWRLAPGQGAVAIAEKAIPGAVLTHAQFSSDGTRLIAAGSWFDSPGAIAVRPANSKVQILSAAALELGSARLTSVAIDAAGEVGALLASDGRVWVWFIDSNDAVFVGRSPGASNVEFTADGKRLVITGSGGAEIWTAPQ